MTESESVALPLGDSPLLNYLYKRDQKAGLAGFEPANAGIKTLCLTAWRQPYITVRGHHTI